MFHRNELREEKRIASLTSHQYAGEPGNFKNGWNKMAGTNSRQRNHADMRLPVKIGLRHIAASSTGPSFAGRARSWASTAAYSGLKFFMSRHSLSTKGRKGDRFLEG
jgi:hypothetical protein